VNIVSFHEVAGALDVAKSRITELEVTLENIKETMASEYRRETQQMEKIHKEEVERNFKSRTKR
jgi:hypothetical protein